MKQKLYVLLGDVISSSRISDRDVFQKKLEEACNEINASYVRDIYADFKILKGLDEIGGVLSSISNSYELLTTILERLYPDLMRFVLVLDYVDTALEARDVAKMDGPAFHKAAHSMQALKKSKFMFDISVGDNIIDTSIAGMINLTLLIKKNWTERQLQIVKEYKKGKNQAEIAKSLGITQQAVSKILNRSMWKEIKGIEGKLEYVLNEYMKREGGAMY